MLTSTNLSGFGMAGDLVLGGSNPFGEPSVFPGGISFGSLSWDGTKFVTDGSTSTIEVLNILLGQGNDHLDVQGTLNPKWGPPGGDTQTTDDPIIRGSGVAVGTATGGTLTRTSGSWVDEGFVPGQLVMLSGQAGTWRVVGVTAHVLTLEGDTLVAGNRTATVPGSHGGITVIHGGGNAPLTITGGMVGGSGSVTRTDGLAWSADGFVVGQRVQVAGETTTRVVLGFTDAVCPPPAPGETGFPGCGTGSTMLLSGGMVASGVLTLHVAAPLRVQASAPVTLTEHRLGPTSSDESVVTVLTRHDGGSFVADGFWVGMQVWISAVAGPRTITAVDATTMTLGGTS